MLQSMRTYSRSALAVLMFILLILTFGAWGIGDIFRNRTPDPIVADVAGTEIRAVVLRDRFNKQLEQIQRSTGTVVPTDQAIALGVPYRILENEIQQAIRERLVKDYGLDVSDEFTRRVLAQEPSFRGATGAFDPVLYRTALQNAGLTEQGYVAGIKRDYSVDELYGSLTGGVMVPPGYADLLYRYRQEKRIVETAVLAFSAIKNVRQPSDEELKAYYDANKTKFDLPEYRKLKYIYVKAEDIVADIKIADDELHTEYEIRLNEFTTPETRDIDQVIFDSEDKANAMADAMQKGKTFDQAAKDILGRDNTVLKMGALAKSALPVQLADPAFDLKEGAISRPIRSPLGWHVLHVNKILPKAVRPFEAVKAELEQTLKKQKAPDRLLKMSNDLEKQLNRGTSFEDAAAALGVKVQTVDAIDARGGAPNGLPATGLPDAKNFLRAAFSQRKGDDSGIQDEANGDFFVVAVQDITPTRTPDLAEVKNKAVAAWQQDETARLTAQKAADIVARINAGTTFAAAVKAENLEIKTAPPITRSSDDAASNLPNALVAKLFDLQPGAAASAPVQSGIAIAVLRTIQPVDPASDKPGVDKLSAELQQAMRGEVLIAFDRVLRQRYTVKIYDDVMAQTFPREQR